MDNNLKGKLIIINVSEIIHVVLRKVWLILTVGVIFAAVGAAYAGMVAKSNVPMYRTTTKLYMASTSSYGSSQALIPNYLEMVKSKPVLEGVIENLGLNMTYSELQGCVSSSTPSGTSMLWITVVFPDAEWAKRVADEVVVVSAAYALEIIGCPPPVVYEEASVPMRAYNTVYSSATKYGVLGFAGGVMLAGFIVLGIYFLKGRFDIPAKVEDRLRVKLLAFASDGKQGGPTREQACTHFMNSMYTNELDTKLLSFVSVSDTEGRTELASEFAQTLAACDKKVLLVDFANDVPEVEEDYNQQNLKKYLAGECALNETVYSAENLDVIYGGNNSGMVCELYSGVRFEAFLDEMKVQYDHVFVNVPAMENHMESAVIAKKTENAVVVLSAKKTSVYRAKQMKKTLENQSVNVLGAILLDVKVQGKAYFKRTYKMFMEG